MARAEEAGNREMEMARMAAFSMKMSNFPNDLLFQRLISPNQFSHKLEETTAAEEEEIELSLGLSLNGRFGVDPRAKKLARSTSVVDFSHAGGREDEEAGFVLPVMTCTGPLIRTCSLPTETEEEWRKRKELQTLRRMEAKRKRTEKQRSFMRPVRERSSSRGLADDNCDEDNKVSMGFSPFGAKEASGFEFKAERANGFSGGFEGLQPQAPLSQGSIGSLGSGSSGISELDSQPIQGMNKCTEAASPASVHSLIETEQKPPVTAGTGTTITEKAGKFSDVVMMNPSDKPAVAEKGAKEMARNVLEDMPCVSTKGDGPNGKRIEGFLYQYRKGEEVRIVCVCHGSFLTPAEFVKHAGGGDVEHPLKHIVVSSSPFK